MRGLEHLWSPPKHYPPDNRDKKSAKIVTKVLKNGIYPRKRDDRDKTRSIFVTVVLKNFTAPITDNLQDSVKRPCICLYLPDISGSISVTDYRPEDAII